MSGFVAPISFSRRRIVNFKGPELQEWCESEFNAADDSSDVLHQAGALTVVHKWHEMLEELRSRRPTG